MLNDKNIVENIFGGVLTSQLADRWDELEKLYEDRYDEFWIKNVTFLFLIVIIIGRSFCLLHKNCWSWQEALTRS